MPKRKFDPIGTNKDNETQESNNEPNNEQEGSRKSAKQTRTKQKVTTKKTAKKPAGKSVKNPAEESAKNSNDDDEVIEVVASSSQGTKPVKSNELNIIVFIILFIRYVKNLSLSLIIYFFRSNSMAGRNSF